MHRTPIGDEIEELIEQAAKFDHEAKLLDGVNDMGPAAKERRAEAERLRSKAQELRPRARLEDLSVHKTYVPKKLANGTTKQYPVWRCSWRSGNRTINKHLGSCSKMTEDQALEKARKLKAEFLGL